MVNLWYACFIWEKFGGALKDRRLIWMKCFFLKNKNEENKKNPNKQPRKTPKNPKQNNYNKNQNQPHLP